MKILYTASQETGLDNLVELIKNTEQDKEFTTPTFISQNNLFTYSTYKDKEIKSLGFSIEKFYMPPYLAKISQRKPPRLLRYLISLLNRKKITELSKEHDIFIFSPGGFLEYMVALRMKRYGKKTIMIEAGLPLFDIQHIKAINKVQLKLSRMIKKIFHIKILKFGLLNDYFQEIDHLVVSGEMSKSRWLENGFPKDKISEIGVPRYGSLFIKRNEGQSSERKLIVYATGAYQLHDDLIGFEEDFKNFKDLVNIVNENFDNVGLGVLVHPRDSREPSLYKEILSRVEIGIYHSQDSIPIPNYLLISRRSSLVYEYIVSGQLAYFYKPNANNEIYPNRNLTVNTKEKLRDKISSYISDSEPEALIDYGFTAISNITPKSAQTILEIIKR